VACAALSVSACSTVNDALGARRGYYTQNLAEMSDEDVQDFAAKQNYIWQCLVTIARAETTDINTTDEDGESPPCTASPSGFDGAQRGTESRVPAGADPVSHGEYIGVVEAGIHYVDVRCDRYMQALSELNRLRETGSRQLQYLGTTSAAVATILSASEELISLLPLGFGFFDQTVNNIGRGLLYELPPHIVRTLVEKQQTAYLAGLPTSYTSKPQALRAIQGYAAICLPSSIEAEVNRSIGNAEYQPIAWDTKPDGSAGAGQSGSPTTQNAAVAGGDPTKRTSPPANTVPGIEQKEPQ
jgi:hypothetical protein